MSNNYEALQIKWHFFVQYFYKFIASVSQACLRKINRHKSKEYLISNHIFLFDCNCMVK